MSRRNLTDDSGSTPSPDLLLDGTPPRPDEWQRVKDIAGAAWARPTTQRAAYLAAACGPDETLALEAGLLVAALAAAELRLEPTGPSVAPAAGDLRSLGPYEILGLVGAGGMGEVYKARDTRLDRMVAIKVLSRPSGTPSAQGLIEREARAVAALNHPHICTLHDIGNHHGLDYLVMEYLDGETLAARLARGPLSVDEALNCAEQIASALQQAHRVGVIHRDLKPGNIMLLARAATESPHVKLLDFGLAKATAADVTPALPDGSRADGIASTAHFLLGTAPYMAPERLGPHATDLRVDIFAFGAVLFEMLTGRRAFDGADRIEVLDAIVASDPPRVSSRRPAIPAALDGIVACCLAKSPDARYETVEPLLNDLRGVRRRSEPSLLRLAMIGGAVAAILIAAIVTGTMTREVTPPTLAPSLTRLASSAGVLGAPALSPDGSNVAFSWFGDGFTDPELVLMRIGSTAHVRLTSDPGADEWPSWSPDGKRIAFIRCGGGSCGIYALAMDERTEAKLLDLPDDRYYGLAWSPDGRVIAYAERPSTADPYALFLLAVETGTTRKITTPSSGLGDMRFAFSPDAKTLAVIRFADAIGVHLLSLDAMTERVLLTGQNEWAGGIAWGASGQHLIVSANQRGIRHLWKLSVGGGELQQIGVAGANAYAPSVSPSGGRMAFVHDFNDWDLWRVTMADGSAASVSPFPSSTRLDLDPAFSPNGQRLAFVSDRGGTREVWISNADGSGAVSVTSLGGMEAGKPSWSPDGQWLAFHASGIHVMPADGGRPRQVATDGEMPTWSADSRWLYFRRADTGQFQIWKIAVDGGTALPAIATVASVAREDRAGATFYFARGAGGIWQRSVSGGQEMPFIAEFHNSLPGYWAVTDGGIYYVAEERRSNEPAVYHLEFFDAARGQSARVATLGGVIDYWVGGLTVSPDRRTIIYSQRAYRTSEIMIVDGFQ